MKLYSENENYKLYQGNMLDMLEVIQPNTIDSVITDPPYELNFMNKGWDNSGIAFNKETWRKCYEALKPGGYLLAFGGTRTFHRIACAIEDAGFEIRDTIMWLYGSGFPKSMNIGLAIDKKNGVESKVIGSGKSGSSSRAYQSEATTTSGEFEIREAQNEWKGWGTALKPSYEPIIVARKPYNSSLIENILEYGVGGINVDECRVPYGNETDKRIGTNAVNTSKCGFWSKDKNNGETQMFKDEGRFPANTILTYDETDFNEVCGGFPETKSQKTTSKLLDIRGNNYNNATKNLDIAYERGYDDSGSASRYFYCAKASKKDRDEGLDDFQEAPLTITESKGRTFNDRCGICGKKFIGSYETICHCENPITDKTKSAPRKNIHPTVKPTELCQYLIRLVSPNNATILDCFNGSGSTGKAVMYENKERNKNYKYIGIELTEEYLPISKARIEYVCNSEVEAEKENQTTIFDFM